MAKNGFKSITIKTELHEKLERAGGSSKSANIMLTKRLKEREHIMNLMSKVTQTPKSVRIYLNG